MTDKADNTQKTSKTNQTPKKRLPKGQRAHIRRVKQEANKNVGGGVPQR